MSVGRVWKSEDHFVVSGSLHQPLPEPQGLNSGDQVYTANPFTQWDNLLAPNVLLMEYSEEQAGLALDSLCERDWPWTLSSPKCFWSFSQH